MQIQLTGSHYFAINHENFISMKKLPVKIVKFDEPGLYDEERVPALDENKVPSIFEDIKTAKIVSA